ncbi:hypothetical protein [Acuticoccus sp.]|uniref:hypothetical protein n=1 Tax=Acuticoccus sp. TaxID=1904378 RepID=UPI003B51B482
MWNYLLIARYNAQRGMWGGRESFEHLRQANRAREDDQRRTRSSRLTERSTALVDERREG